ncbi:Transient receptor potential cation channel subfamily A member 1 [Portunus trituberculatus]|uniref:Transient receptor potential cation channel subfamily A member 1 n=1 Tax=Portunus trituberculatus TaxID=210409 RepID=A0A5B7ISD7_PORTR|nr:Transient receptor potential cation channel subfamily A member 1 [Portunus trituberculatus]
MMIGEINYVDVFNNPASPLQYPEVTYMLLVAFLVIMSILIMNLLVGLAVDDIKAVQDQAMLEKLAMQTKVRQTLAMETFGKLYQSLKVLVIKSFFLIYVALGRLSLLHMKNRSTNKEGTAKKKENKPREVNR